jgi:hypothetical protein
VSEAGLSTVNNIYAPANTTANNAVTNNGLTERLSYINLDFTGLSLGTVATSAVSNLIPESQIKQLYVSHISKTGVGVVDVSSPFVQYSVRATIMLKDIHPLFDVIPISKSLNFKIQVFWNNSSFTATHSDVVPAVPANPATNTDAVDAKPAGWSSQSAQYRAYNGTVPLMLNNWDTGFTGSAVNTTLRTSIYVGDTYYDTTQKSVAPGILTGAVGKQVESWVPAYQMLVDMDKNYSEGHKKLISYNGYNQFCLKGVAPTDTFNHLVSNGISYLKACLIVSFLSNLDNNDNAFDDGLPQSFAHINQFSINVGGSNVLHQDSRYDYQQFNNEIFNEFGINGNHSPGIGSGLIDFKSWVKKSFYYVNCSRVP